MELGDNRYGKQAIRLVKVDRAPDRHTLRDLTVGVSLEGDFTASYADADNSLVIPTDTMKNTVYALAPEHLTGPIEAFAIALVRHFGEAPQVTRATVSIREHAWDRLDGAAGPAPDAFRRLGGATRTTVVSGDAGSPTVDSGIEDLVVMKTSRSAFAGFPRDRFTTLPEASDRIMATRISATWRHGSPAGDWDASHASLVRALLEAFVDHVSESVQHSIWVVGRAMLAAAPEIDRVSMSLPNLHHWAVDLASLGGTNRGEVFVATTEPHGLIEATVHRTPDA